VRAGLGRQLGRRQRPAAPAPHAVQRAVAGDAEQPGRDRPPALVEAVGEAPGPHERLLGHVLGVAGVADDGERQAVDLALEAAHEGRRRGGVAGREAGEERLVGDVPHALCTFGGPDRISAHPPSRPPPAPGRNRREIRAGPRRGSGGMAETRRTRTPVTRRAWSRAVVAVAALALLAAACGDDDGDTEASGGGGGDDLSITIETPADGASVDTPFEVKVDPSVDIGEPDTGLHHVHLYYDGEMAEGDYDLVYEPEFTVERDLGA